MKITTKTGDKGETRLFGGKKVKKDAPEIEVIGGLDELQSFIGLCRFVIGAVDGEEICGVLDRVQDDLYRMMGIVGNGMESPEGVIDFGDDDIEFLEGQIVGREKVLEGVKGFVRPGTTEIAARFQVVRSVCRRVERDLVRYQEELGIPGVFLIYLNRLSDLLFILAYKFEAR